VKTQDVMIQTPATQKRRRATRLVAILLLGVIAGGVIFALLRSGDDAPTTDASPQPSTQGELSAVAAELASLVARGQDRTYRALYRVKGDESRGSVEIEVWRKGGVTRQEERITAAGKTVTTAAYRLKDRIVICTRADDDAWTCSPGPEGASVDALTGSVASQLEGEVVRSRGEDEIDGRRAKCYSIAGDSKSGASEICLDKNGVPLALRAGPARLEIVELDSNVRDEDFVPPIAV
jgi:hypothetical protein